MIQCTSDTTISLETNDFFYCNRGWLLPVIVKKCHFLPQDSVKQLVNRKKTAFLLIKSTISLHEQNILLTWEDAEKPTLMEIKTRMLSLDQHCIHQYPTIYPGREEQCGEMRGVK